jgi:hypothetical protein
MAVPKRPAATFIIFTIMIVISVVASSVVRGAVNAEIVAKKKVMVGEAVLFDGSRSSSSNVDVLNYSWDVDGDGKADAYDKYFTYIYSDSGTYTITLTVAAGNMSDIATATIIVESVFISLMPYFGFTVVAIVLLIFLSIYWRKKDIDDLQLLREKRIAPMKKKIKKVAKKYVVEKPPSPPFLHIATKPMLKKRKIKREVKALRAGTPIPKTPLKVGGDEKKPSEETVVCPSCGKTISAYAVICESCGAIFADEYLCTSCGATVPEDWETCPKCGAKLM